MQRSKMPSGPQQEYFKDTNPSKITKDQVFFQGQVPSETKYDIENML